MGCCGRVESRGDLWGPSLRVGMGGGFMLCDDDACVCLCVCCYDGGAYGGAYAMEMIRDH